MSTRRDEVSKSRFKANALEIMREVERSGQPVIITDRGRQALIVKKFRPDATSAFERLKGSVLRYERPFEPVAADTWEALA